MPINFNIDLSARRRQQQALADLEKQRQAMESLTGQLLGTPTEGPPTATGLQSRMGGMLPGGPMADLVETQLTSGVPALQQGGLASAQALLEQQRQQQLEEAKRAQLLPALQSPAIQATPEGRAIANLIEGGATAEQIKLFESQLSPFTLSPEQRRFGGAGGTIAVGPQKAEDLESERKRIFDQSTKLRGEFTGITKPYEDQNQAYGRVIASAQDSSPAGDLALIFNFMKVLDPGSTVREGEFAQVGAAGGLPTQAQRLFDSWVTGKKLTDSQRTDVVGRATKLFKQASSQHKKTAEEFRALAKRRGLPPEDVVFQRQTVDFYVPPPPPGTTVVEE